MKIAGGSKFKFTQPEQEPPHFGPEEVLFDQRSQCHLDSFFQMVAGGEQAPHFFIDPQGRLTYAGSQGNFGLLVAKEPAKDFCLEIEFEAPSATGPLLLANSGGFVRIADPRLPHTAHSKLVQQAVEQDTQKYGTGFWAANATGYEIQLEMGYGLTLPQEERAGALYKVPLAGCCP